jgi:hypothetical protein
MRTLLIASDLGQLRAYVASRDSDDRSPTIELIQESDFLGRRHHFADRDTDQGGRFPSGAAGMQGGMPNGEQHEEMEKAQRVRMRQVAEAVDVLAAADEEAEIYFAAPKPVHRHLVALLNPAVRKRIRKRLELDLVKLPKLELLRRFEQC